MVEKFLPKTTFNGFCQAFDTVHQIRVGTCVTLWQKKFEQNGTRSIFSGNQSESHWRPVRNLLAASPNITGGHTQRRWRPNKNVADDQSKIHWRPV